MGFCNGYESPAYTQAAFGGRGMGMGRRFGRGFAAGRGNTGRAGRIYAPPVQRYSKSDQLEMLKEEARCLNEDLVSVRARIEELEKREEKE
jgi:hypothetical protein